MSTYSGSLLEGLRDYFAVYKRLHEHQALRNRPWEEDFLHWSLDGELHGHLPPPQQGRRHSVASDGWCPGRRYFLSDER
jgi:hypothetical protein